MGRSSLVPEAEFLRLFQELGAQKTAEHLGINVRSVYDRRANIEKRSDVLVENPNNVTNNIRLFCGRYPKRLPVSLKDGVLISGSDAHWYKGRAPTATRGMVYLIKELQPKLVNLNGDLLDGADISRHSPLGWESKPSVKEELEVVDERLTEIKDAAKQARTIWTIGNHDMRFDARLAQDSPQYREVRGFALTDHFPHWELALSAWVNEQLVVKHRFKGGIHATHNNALWSGKSMLTGHLHSLKVTPFDDYNGTRWGIDSGTLSDPYGDHTDYTEDNPLNHRSGGVVLTFFKGKLIWPEIFSVIDEEHIQFRGQVIKV